MKEKDADVSAGQPHVEKHVDGESEGGGRRQERKRKTHTVDNAY